MSRGFSVIELLVVLLVIGVLLGLLLPAVQAVRESGRNSDCQNRLRQIGLALLIHHDVEGRFPYGGWGHTWVGVPGRGGGIRQPGGWIYNILPHVEEQALHDLGLQAEGTAADEAYSHRLTTPVCLFNCPTRRPCQTWAIADAYAYVRTPRPFGRIESAARSDYAINAGTSHVLRESGPVDLTQGDSAAFWRNKNVPGFSGICHLRTGVVLASILDGTSNTYLLGEKYLAEDRYDNGLSPGDNETMYSGYCSDLHRFTGITKRLSFQLQPFAPPLHDSRGDGADPSGDLRFGSAHRGGFNMVYCDGSTRHLDFEVDEEIHLRAGHRRDQGRDLRDLD